MSKRIETELWDVADLIPYTKNAKKHPVAQVKKLAKLIKEHGWTQPIVIDGENVRGSVVVGHGRRLAAIHLELKKIPVQVLYGYSLAEIDALRLADNRVSSTDYDSSLMQDELLRLSGEDIDMLDFGFDAKELEFADADLGELDDSAFTEDIGSAVEAQSERNKEIIGETDAGTTPLADAFGFKKITVAQSRKIRAFMTRVEFETEQTGAAALVAYIEENKL
jgi:hypothetical protein